MNNQVWIIQRHTSDMRLLVTVANFLLEKQGSSINKEEINNIIENLKEKKIYKPRKTSSHNTFRRKISLLCYFMIGY